MRGIFHDEDTFLAQEAAQLLGSGGKRLRPSLLLLAARLGQGSGAQDHDEVIKAAAAAELIHMATLIHDDLIDGASQRRNAKTIHVVWGAKPAVLAGDYLFAHAFSLLGEIGKPNVVKHMADAVSGMCEGEMLQNDMLFAVDRVHEEEYFGRIGKKTALFVATVCRVGGMLGGLSEVEQEALYRYGWEIGMAFQMRDDILDFIGDPHKFGKEPCGDLRSGVLTLPMLHILREQEMYKLLSPWLKSPLPVEKNEWVIQLLHEHGSLQYAQDLVDQRLMVAKQCLQIWPSSPWVLELKALADGLAVREM